MTSLSAPPSSPQSGKSELDATLARFRRAYSPARLNAGLDRIAADAEAAGLDIDGLRLVMKAVEEAPADKFDLSTWTCGTTHCGIGWFCVKNPGDELKLLPHPADPTFLRHAFRNEKGFSAIAARFGLGYVEACDLFDSVNPGGGLRRWSKTQFLERLDQFICDHAAPAPRLADLSSTDYAAAAVEAEEEEYERFDMCS